MHPSFVPAIPQSNKKIVALQDAVIARRDAATSLVRRLKSRRESDRCATRLGAFRTTFARIRNNDAVRRPCDQIRESTVITGLDSSLWASEETRDWFNEGAATPRRESVDLVASGYLERSTHRNNPGGRHNNAGAPPHGRDVFARALVTASDRRRCYTRGAAYASVGTASCRLRPGSVTSQ